MRRRSLRFGITLSLLLFVSISSGLFALAIYNVNAHMEEQLLDEALDHEFDAFQQRYREGRQLPLPYSTQMRTYLVDSQDGQSLPPALRQLSPGTHHDVDFDGRSHHVLNRVMGDRRVYIVYDISRIEQRESQLALFLVVGVLLASAIAVWVGYLLSRSLIAPVTALANRVSDLDPGRLGHRLADEFTGLEVEVIARAFDRFLDRFVRFMEREQAFTQDASHELRTPLAVIDNAAELALAVPDLPDQARQPLLRIRRASQQMTRLTSTLLFLARESDNRAEGPESCQVDRLIPAIVESYRPLLADKPVQLQVEIHDALALPVSASFIEIVVANLLQNAIAHTPRGEIYIELKDAVLTVEDTGSGIDEKDLPHIFERDYRGAGSHGIGRGLDLVKRVCDRHGWRITASSPPGHGARFTLHFRG